MRLRAHARGPRAAPPAARPRRARPAPQGTEVVGPHPPRRESLPVAPSCKEYDATGAARQHLSHPAISPRVHDRELDVLVLQVTVGLPNIFATSATHHHAPDLAHCD